MCDNCIHKAVCFIFRATGGVKKCEHFGGEKNLFATVCDALASMGGESEGD